VVGSPVAHSISPQMHAAAYRALGLDQWMYGRELVAESGFAAFLSGLGPQWRGLSLTMPLKEVVFDVGVPMSDLAAQVGSANTLVRRTDGGWVGDNTDVHGVLAALGAEPEAVSAGTGAGTGAGTALVLGSGATARSVLAALRELGIGSVDLAVRDRARPRTLALARELGLSVRTGPLSDAASRVLDAPVVVSTLPPEGAAGVAAALSALCARGHPAGRPGVLLDVVYAGWPTPLAGAFAAAGGRVVSGFEMVLHQAGEQVRLMTGLEPPLEAMREAGRAAMAPVSS